MNLVEILVTAKDLTGPATTSVNAKVNSTGKGMALLNKTAKLGAAGLVAVGVESVIMASKFDASMTLLQTQAGVSQDKMAGLKAGVLDLAGKVAQSPDSLAEALFHVESNFASMGISSSKALALTETAAKGATVGHADLVDVTNALTAAVASGIPGVENFDQAMGVLNATVGSGDMKMQDLANAFGSGMVATVKGFGLSIVDVGAALATFGDNNIRGALAGNQLRQSVMALAKPIAGGAATLKSIGLEADTLAHDMQKGGLKLALEDLVAHMKAAGISSKEQGMIITEAFGRKAGSGLNILVGQMDRLESKYPEITKGAKNFSQSWEDTKKTFAFQMKSMQTGFEALMIGLGQKIIPPLQSFIGFLKEHKTVAIGATEAMGGLLAVTIAFGVAMKVAGGAKLLKDGLASVTRQAALMEGSFIAAGGGVAGLKAAFASLSSGAKLGVAIVAIGALALAVDHFSGGKKAPDVDRLATALGNLADKGKVTGELAKSFGGDLSGLAGDIDKLGGKKDALDHVNDALNAVFTLGMKGSNGPKQAKKDLDSIDKGLAQLVTGGHADRAAAALAKISETAGKKIPPGALDDYTAALAGTKLQSDLTAQSQGRFGDEAQVVQAKLQAQQDVVDGLVNSLQALDQVNQDAYSSQTKFEDSIAALTQGLKDNGKTLSLRSDKGRQNRDLVVAEAAATDDYTAKLNKQGASWDTIDAAYKRGYDSLVKFAVGAGYGKDAAEKLAKSLLHIPPEIKTKGDITDFQSKLAKMKAELKAAPKSKQVAIRGNIAQLENAIRDAQARVNAMTGKEIVIRATYSVVGGKGMNIFHEGGGYASGGRVIGPGSGTSDDVPIWASNGEFVVNADAARRHRGLLEAINNGGHGMAAFAKGGPVLSKAQKAAADRAKARAEAEAQARGDALGSLSMSHFGQMAGYKATGFERSTGSPADLGELVSSLNGWAGKIKAATHGAQESKLLHALDRLGASAIKNEQALSKVNLQLDGAKNKLSTLKDSFAQLRDGISSSIVSFGSIAKTGGAGPLGQVSVGEQLRQSVGQAQEFAQDLAKLKKKGLNAQSLSEIAQAGIEGGGLETAQRLLGSSSGDIKEINSLEKALIAAGKAAGTTTADSMYGAGIKQAQGVVDGLKKEQAHLNEIMAKAADAMARELKRALGGGRKGAGGTVGAAASGGNRWGRTWVGEYGAELLDLPVGSRVHSAPDSQRMTSGGSGLSEMHITLMIGDAVLGELSIDPLRKVIRRQGGNVQAVLGVRGK